MHRRTCSGTEAGDSCDILRTSATASLLTTPRDQRLQRRAIDYYQRAGTLWATQLVSREGEIVGAKCCAIHGNASGRLHGVEVDKDGRARVLAPGRTIPAGELPGNDLDLVFLSIRLTLVEKYSAQAKVPVIFEDAFRGVVDATKLPLVIRMLKHLGTLTQILHVTPSSHAASPTDPVLAL